MNEIVHVHVYSSAQDAQYARFLDLLQARFLGSAKLNGGRLYHAAHSNAKDLPQPDDAVAGVMIGADKGNPVPLMVDTGGVQQVYLIDRFD